MNTRPDVEYTFEEVEGRVHCFRVIDGERGPEVCAGLNFHRATWMRDQERLIAAARLPLIEIPLQPRAMPDQLKELSDDEEVVLRDAVAEFDVASNAGRARKQLTDRMARVRREQLSSREAAALLADMTDESKASAFERILDAFVRGVLVFRNTNGRFVADAGRLDSWFGKSGPKYVLAEIGGEASAYTTRKEMNLWLEKEGHPDRLPTAVSFTDDASTSVTEAPDPQRRLAALRALGGTADWHGNEWRFKGIGKLEEQERSAGRPRSSAKTIQADLRAAAEAERKASREGTTGPSVFPTASR